VFAWFSFIGCYLFYRAFRMAYPDGDHKRYRLLVFFFPSMLFLPSSIGKEAWMILLLGICAVGVANLLNGRLRGLLWLSIGMGGAVVVRPHIALIILGGLAVSIPMIRRRGGARGLASSPVAKVVL